MNIYNVLTKLLVFIAVCALEIILFLLILTVAFRSVKTVVAPEASAHGLSSTNDKYIINGIVDKPAILAFITKTAKEYGVNPNLATCIARKESINFKKEVLTGEQIGDQHLICNTINSPTYGKAIQSVGVFQWNLCVHWNIPFSDASNIEEATTLAMGTMKTNPEAWSTYKDCK